MNESHISFFEVVIGSGTVGIIIWMWLFILTLAGLILGVISILTSSSIKTNKYPVALKLLFCCMAAILSAGAHGTIVGYVDTFAQLATTTGSDKATILELSFQISHYNIKFAIIAVFIQLILAGISFWIIEQRSKKLSLPALSLVEKIKKIPVLLYLLIFALLLSIFGNSCAFWGIKEMLQLSCDQCMPLLLGLNFGLIMKICLISSIIGIILLIILLITSLKPKKEKQV